MTTHDTFRRDCDAEIAAQAADPELRNTSRRWMNQANAHKYSYHFEWLGRPIIQYPQDIVALQQVIWQVQPDLIVETGIAHGGSLIFSASLLELNACGGPADGQVLGIDIDIRAPNRAAIDAHPMSRRIAMIEGSSTAPEVIARVHAKAAGRRRVLVLLDSNHTHDHVLAELDAYAPLVGAGSYCVVFDTVIDDMPASMFPDRPWGPGDNPRTAVRAWLAGHPSSRSTRIDAQLLVGVAPGGWLKRVR